MGSRGGPGGGPIVLVGPGGSPIGPGGSPVDPGGSPFVLTSPGGNPVSVVVNGFVGSELQLAAQIDRLLTRRSKTSTLGFN